MGDRLMLMLEQVKAALAQTLDEGVDARPNRQRQPTQPVKISCKLCRARKAMCFGEPGQTCPRCERAGVVCEYPSHGKPGRKSINPKVKRLKEAHDTLEEVMRALGTTEASPASTVSPRTTGSSSSFTKRKRLSVNSALSAGRNSADGTSKRADRMGVVEVEMENPATLMSTLNPQEEGSDSEDSTGNYPSEAAAERYFSTGLYQSLPDTNPLLDPVYLGLMTMEDLERLLELYFHLLRPFLWMLNPALHTASYLRSVSPFLTTALAASVAHFCPYSGHLVKPLEAHAKFLSARCFTEGLKSIEIVQAYCLLAHWISPEDVCVRDQSWKLSNEAFRIAKEIRLDRPLDAAGFQEYTRLAVLPENGYELLNQDRIRTNGVMFCIELCLSVLTGRMAAIPGMTLVGGLHTVPEALAPDNADYSMVANDILNRYFAKALNLAAGLQAEGATPDPELREAFNASWMADLDQWAQNWPLINHFIKVHHLNLRLILLSVSLRFAGPVEPILNECKKEAASTLHLVAEWIAQDHSILYASNYVVVDIAYSAILLLKLIGIEDERGRDLVEWEEIKVASSQVASTLEQIGVARFHSASLASLHATRIRTLLRRLDRTIRIEHAQQPEEEIQEDIPTWDDSLLATEFLDWFKTDPYASTQFFE